jgi:predicted transcriptional regulator of viral defense system
MKEYFTFSSWVALLQKLGKEQQKILTPQALQNACGLSRAAVAKAIQRLHRRDYLVKLCKKTYANKFALPRLEEAAMFVGKPCYVSFESELANRGVISQSPQVLTCATTRKIQNLKTPLGEIIFHRLSPGRFSGYENAGGVLHATPEKALLDYLYITAKTKGRVPATDEFDLAALNLKKLKLLARAFPKSVRKRLPG